MAWQLQLGFLCPEFLLPVWLYCHQREGQNMNSVAFVLDMQNPVLPSRNLDMALHQTIRTWPHLHVGEPKGCEKLQLLQIFAHKLRVLALVIIKAITVDPQEIEKTRFPLAIEGTDIPSYTIFKHLCLEPIHRSLVTMNKIIRKDYKLRTNFTERN